MKEAMSEKAEMPNEQCVFLEEKKRNVGFICIH